MRAEWPRLICPAIPVIIFRPRTAIMVMRVMLVKISQLMLPVQ